MLPDLDFAGRIALARRHLDMLCRYHGEARALRIGRKYVAWTIRGCAGAARLRAEVQTMDTRERLDDAARPRACGRTAARRLVPAGVRQRRGLADHKKEGRLWKPETPREGGQ